MESKALVLGTLLGGALSGVIGVVVGAKWLAHAEVAQAPAGPQKETNTESAPRPTRLSASMSDMRGKLGALEQRLDDMERNKETREPEAAPAPDENDPTESSTVLFERAITAHRAEPRDESWAQPTETSLKTDLTSLREDLRAKVSEVTCASTTCVATLEWPDRKSAIDHWQQALVSPLRSGCERSIIVPEAKQGESSVSVQVLFECENWRAEGSPMLSEQEMAALRPPRSE